MHTTLSDVSRRLILPAAVLALSLSACGSSSSTSPVANNSTVGSTVAGAADANRSSSNVDQKARRAAMQAFRDCMATNGVALPQRQRPNQNPQGDNSSGSTTTSAGGSNDGSGDNGGQPPFDPNGVPPLGGNNASPGGFQLGGATAPTGIDQAAYTKALASCKDKIPAAGFGRGNGGGGRNNNPVYVACMKDNGIVIPVRPSTTTTVAGATTSSTDSTTTSSQPRLDRTSPGYKAANDKCKALLPANQQGANQQDPNASTTTTTSA